MLPLLLLSPSLCPLGLASESSAETRKIRSLINLLYDFSPQLNTYIDSYVEKNSPAFKNGENALKDS